MRLSKVSPGPFKFVADKFIEQRAHPFCNKKMADRTGFEPATSGVTGRHSNQLNYRSVECYLMVGAEGVEPPTFAL